MIFITHFIWLDVDQTVTCQHYYLTDKISLKLLSICFRCFLNTPFIYAVALNMLCAMIACYSCCVLCTLCMKVNLFSRLNVILLYRKTCFFNVTYCNYMSCLNTILKNIFLKLFDGSEISLMKMNKGSSHSSHLAGATSELTM